MICPNCKQPTTPETGYLLCRHCGASLYDNILERIPTKRLDRAYHQMPSRRTTSPLLIYVNDSEVPVTLERADKIHIGRSDPANVFHTIELDLANFQAHQHGVSRRHAVLNAAHDVPMLMDLGSYNGTYVNGKKIAPNRSFGLRSGDKIRFGRLLARVYFK